MDEWSKMTDQSATTPRNICYKIKEKQHKKDSPPPTNQSTVVPDILTSTPYDSLKITSSTISTPNNSKKNDFSIHPTNTQSLQKLETTTDLLLREQLKDKSTYARCNVKNVSNPQKLNKDVSCATLYDVSHSHLYTSFD